VYTIIASLFEPLRSSVQHDGVAWELVRISLTWAICCAACAIPTLLLWWKSTAGVVEIESRSLRISELGWSSQDQHGQYHNVCKCKLSLHLYPRHCVQVFNMMELHENWWESIWPGRYPVLRVRYRHCFSGEKVQPVWSKWKGIHFESQIWDDPHKISMATIMMGDHVSDHCIFFLSHCVEVCLTWWSFIERDEDLTDPSDYLCCLCDTDIASQ